MAKTFKFLNYRCCSEKNEDGSRRSSALVKVKVDGKVYLEAAEGVGPVNALAKALVKALSAEYPLITKIQLIHYDAKIINDKGTASIIRVNVTLGDDDFLSENSAESDDIVDASYAAVAACVNEFLEYTYP